MHNTFGLLALAASAVQALPQGVTANIPPPSPAPAGCMPDYSGTFQITVVNVTNSASKKAKRQAEPLECTLSGGILKDAKDRTGYIASNYQFQFDGPPQAGALYTAGFSVCGNNTMALGGSAIFYQCYSGGFYNLYDRHWAPQCSPVYIEVMGGSGGAAPAPAPAPAPPASGVASQIGDGQVQATPVPVGQIGDGQIQQNPAMQIGDGQVQAPKPVVSQIGDGQVQASPAPAPKPAVSQIGDGQVQASPAPAPKPAVSQIGDGQVQASPAPAPKPAVSQIGDGQVQASPAPAPAPKPSGVVSQIGDGQIQASPRPVVTQIGDGQVQNAASATSAYAPAQQTINAAPALAAGPAAFFGLIGAALLY